jgi:hypothetical protein
MKQYRVQLTFSHLSKATVTVQATDEEHARELAEELDPDQVDWEGVDGYVTAQDATELPRQARRKRPTRRLKTSHPPSD